MSKSSFISDLNARILEAERIIAHQNENLAALRHLLRIESGESTPEIATHKSAESTQTHPDVDYKGKTSDIILTLVHRSGDAGIRPRDIAETLVKHNLIHKGSNAVYSYLSEFKKKGLVRQKSEGIYVASAKPATNTTAGAPTASPKKPQKKRKLSPEGREAIRRAVKARWAAAKKSTG